MPPVPARLLPWDTEHFGFRVARATEAPCSADEAVRLRAWCAAERVRCCHLLAGGDDAGGIAHAESVGFARIDTRLTFAKELHGDEAGPVAATVARAEPAHRAALLALARTAHTDSRFFVDGRFPREASAALFERWIAQAVDGVGDETAHVAIVAGRAAGYVTIAPGRIGLLAVDSAHRGHGLGGALVDHAAAVASAQGHRRLSVVTQEANAAAVALYRSRGFGVAAREVWLHLWLD